MSSKPKRKRSRKIGLPPGTLVHIGEQKVDQSKISLFHYTETQLEERVLSTIEECIPYAQKALQPGENDKPGILWINIDGLHDISLIEQVGKQFGLHPLVLEDILNTAQRPKKMDYDNYLYIALRTLNQDPKSLVVESEQLSFILGRHFVITFQEKAGDCFNHVRERIRSAKGRIRKSHADYLLYALLDSIVDHYFVILEDLGEKVELLEEELIDDAPDGMLHKIHRCKKEMVFLRRAVWPLREIVSGVERDDSDFICDSTRLYLRDVYDHTIEVIEIVETLRDMSSGMIELYVSNVSNKVNAVMKTLTVIATIFMPLTFIVGVYGMNFEYLPELKWRYGYLATWLVMLTIAFGMIFHFRRKKWI